MLPWLSVSQSLWLCASAHSCHKLPPPRPCSGRAEESKTLILLSRSSPYGGGERVVGLLPPFSPVHTPFRQPLPSLSPLILDVLQT